MKERMNTIVVDDMISVSLFFLKKGYLKGLL